MKGIENKELGSGNVDDLDVSEMAGKNRRNVGCYDMLWCPTVRFQTGSCWGMIGWLPRLLFVSFLFFDDVCLRVRVCVFGFVVIEWCAVGIWKHLFQNQSLPAKWSDGLEEHPLHTGRCLQYQVSNAGKQCHQVSPPNHELQVDMWTNTIHFICY